MIHQLIYASRASREMSEADVAGILAIARKNNAASGVTGMLLYDAGSFLQVLEGERAAVDRIFAKLSTDRRHTAIVVLNRSDVERRGFGDWSMGLLELSPAVRALPGISEFLHTGVAAISGESKAAVKVLQGFRDGQYRRHVR